MNTGVVSIQDGELVVVTEDSSVKLRIPENERGHVSLSEGDKIKFEMELREQSIPSNQIDMLADDATQRIPMATNIEKLSLERCSECGKTLSEFGDVNFCPECGAEIQGK